MKRLNWFANVLGFVAVLSVLGQVGATPISGGLGGGGGGDAPQQATYIRIFPLGLLGAASPEPSRVLFRVNFDRAVVEYYVLITDCSNGFSGELRYVSPSIPAESLRGYAVVNIRLDPQYLVSNRDYAVYAIATDGSRNVTDSTFGTDLSDGSRGDGAGSKGDDAMSPQGSGELKDPYNNNLNFGNILYLSNIVPCNKRQSFDPYDPTSYYLYVYRIFRDRIVENYPGLVNLRPQYDLDWTPGDSGNP